MDFFHSNKKKKNLIDTSINGQINEISNTKISLSSMSFVNLYLKKFESERNFYCLKHCIQHSNFHMNKDYILLNNERECLDDCKRKQVEVENLIIEQMSETGVLSKESSIYDN